MLADLTRREVVNPVSLRHSHRHDAIHRFAVADYLLRFSRKYRTSIFASDVHEGSTLL